MFGNGNFAGMQNFMQYGDKHQLAAAALFVLDRNNTGAFLDTAIQRQRFLEFKLSTGPHTIRQRHGRQEASSRGVTITPQLFRRQPVKKIQPVPQWRQWITRDQIALWDAQRCSHQTRMA
ncbi:hypothetical protein D3C87_1638490 [compost metagenome]